MNWFDLIVLLIVGITLVKGAMSGLVMQLASLAGVILGAIFAGQLSNLIAPKIVEWTSASSHIIGPLSYIVAFVLIMVAIFFLGKLVESAMKALQINTANRLAGALFCSIKWLVVFSILINLIVEFDQGKRLIKEEVRENAHTYSLVKEIACLAIPYLKFDWAK